MDLEIIGADFTQEAKVANEGDDTNSHETENDCGKPIWISKFEDMISDEMSGSCLEEEDDGIRDEMIPRDSSLDERCRKRRIHSFYFVKFPYYQDPKLRIKIEQACEQVHMKGRLRHDITEEIKYKTDKRLIIERELQALTGSHEWTRKQGRGWKWLPVEQVKFCNENTFIEESHIDLCSSQEQLNDNIRSLHHHMHHKVKNLVEEKQMLKAIKQLEGTREKVIALETLHLNSSPIKQGVGTIRKMQSKVGKTIKILEKEHKIIDRVINSLQEEQTIMSQKQIQGHEILYELWREHEEENACFYQSRSLLNHAKDLAAKRDIDALMKISHKKNEKFMSMWSNSKATRDEYRKKILSSLDSRKLSIDGRTRNIDEKPLVSEAQTRVVSEKELAKLIFDTIEDIVQPISSWMALKRHAQKKGELLKCSQHL